VSTTLSFFAFEPGAPGVPAASGTGAFVTELVRLIQETDPALDVRMRWLRPADTKGVERTGERRRAGAAWLVRQLGHMLRDRSRYLVFIYPKVPVLAHVNEPTMLSLAHRAYQVLRLKTAAASQRIVVIVEDLPVELAQGRAIAGAPARDLAESQIRAIERTLFRAAHRLVVPSGFVEPITARYGIDRDRFRTFRRNVYQRRAAPETSPPIQFEGGKVNFFYSGSVDTHVAPNFREILRSIRNAPGTRLHVCGPGRESVQEWLHELDAPNVSHYGQLDVTVHDWLAQRCDIGLILYPTDNPYNHLTPTMKYSAYLANGLAILSTDLRCVADNVRHDGVGLAMPIRELAVELMRWATRPTLWADSKARAEEEAAAIGSGAEMKEWIEEIVEGR
jgi:hypothetical protein